MRRAYNSGHYTVVVTRTRAGSSEKEKESEAYVILVPIGHTETVVVARPSIHFIDSII